MVGTLDVQLFGQGFPRFGRMGQTLDFRKRVGVFSVFSQGPLNHKECGFLILQLFLIGPSQLMQHRQAIFLVLQMVHSTQEHPG